MLPIWPSNVSSYTPDEFLQDLQTRVRAHSDVDLFPFEWDQRRETAELPQLPLKSKISHKQVVDFRRWAQNVKSTSCAHKAYMGYG